MKKYEFYSDVYIDSFGSSIDRADYNSISKSEHT